MSVLKCGAMVGLLWACSAAAVSAQTTGTLVGRCSDQSDAVLPGATVEVVNVGTGFVRSVVTDAQGMYLAPGLPLGGYKVTVTLPGFATFIQVGITVQLNQNARVDAKLALEGLAETVNVQGDAPLVETRSSTMGATLTALQVETLPLSGRNPLALAQMLPGVGAVTIETAPVRGGVQMNVSGGRPNSNSLMLDGAVLSQGMTGAGLNLPNPDTLEEFRILTNNFSAEFGRAEGAIVLAATKSGTNQLRGRAWEFMRHDALNGRNFFASEKPFLRQHQFGGTVGGPIVHNRAFFFGSYEGLRIRQQQLIQGFPTTAAERQGDFSAFQRPIIDPATGQPFPGNIIPAGRIDPLARNILSEFIPLPNQPEGSLQQLRSIPLTGNQLLAKIDQQVTSNIRASYRLFRNKYEDSARGGGISERLVGLADSITTAHTASYSHVFTPSLFNELRVSYSRWDNHNSPARGLKDLQELGAKYISGADDPGATSGPPRVNVVGRMSIPGGGGVVTHDSRIQIDNKLVWNRGRHDITAGFRFMRNRHSDLAHQNTSGDFQFNGAFTGNAMADFLIGRPNFFTEWSTIHDDGLAYEYHLFVNDDFQLSRNVTVNLGVRYSLDPPWVQMDDQNSAYRPGQQSTRFPNAPPGLVMAGDPGVPRGLYPTDKNNVAPRLGVAWDLAGDGRTALRGGYGIFYTFVAEGMSAYATNNPPFILTPQFVPPSFSDPWSGRVSPYPYDFASNPQFTAPFEINFAGVDFTTGYLHQFNLGLQRQIGQNLATTVAYVGSRGRKLMQAHNMNQPVFRPGATASNVQQRRPVFPQHYATMGIFTSDASSRYDSLQLEVRKRFSKGYTFQLAYTLSKATTNSSIPGLFGGGNALQDSSDRFEANEGPTPFDQRHVFAVNGTWNIPGPGNRSAASRALLEGWTVAGTVRLASGFPINVTSGCDCALIGGAAQLGGVQRPNRVGDPKLPSNRSRDQVIAQYFNTAAFAFPATGQFGNEPRHSLVGPGFAQADLLISRRIPVGFGSVEFRGEVFNLLNRVNFRNPTAPMTSPGFGRLVAAGDPRIVQFGLKYEF